MTSVKKVSFKKGNELYRVWENGQVKYYTLDEVLRILSTKEKESQEEDD